MRGGNGATARRSVRDHPAEPLPTEVLENNASALPKRAPRTLATSEISDAIPENRPHLNLKSDSCHDRPFTVHEIGSTPVFHTDRILIHR